MSPIKPIFHRYIYWVSAGILAACSTPPGNHPNQQGPGSEKAFTAQFAFNPLPAARAEHYKNEIALAYQKLLGKNFNGSILVAKNGTILLEAYQGYIDFKNREPVSPSTPFHLASISKTFTGMAILRMWQQGRLSLEDTLQRFFPALPYHGITIRMLLDHRSGLPNYLYFMDSCWDKKKKATNEDVLQFMVQHQPRPYNLPNKSFHYCNTNFLLLAMVIEKLSGQSYPQYMKDSVFIPLGMNHTYVFSIKDTSRYIPTYAGNRPYLMDHTDCTYGDKNIYSTVRDMLQWDKALYLHTFVHAATLDTALKPNSLERPSMHNYGLGWRLFFNKGDTLVYHNGKWHGSNTVFARLVQDTATIIVLGNRFNRSIYSAKKMGDLFTGSKDDSKLEE